MLHVLFLPLFTVVKAGCQISASQKYVRHQLHTLTTRAGLPVDKYDTDSILPGCAAYMFLAGVPVSVIKQIGD